MATMAWCRSGNVLVIVHTDRPPTAERAVAMDLLRRGAAAQGLSIPFAA